MYADLIPTGPSHTKITESIIEIISNTSKMGLAIKKLKILSIVLKSIKNIAAIVAAAPAKIITAPAAASLATLTRGS